MYPRPWSPAEYLSLVGSNGRQCRRRQFFPRKQPTVKRIPGSRSRSGGAGTNGAGLESQRAPEPRLASFIDGTEGCVLLEDKNRPPHAGLRGESRTRTGRLRTPHRAWVSALGQDHRPAERRQLAVRSCEVGLDPCRVRGPDAPERPTTAARRGEVALGADLSWRRVARRQGRGRGRLHRQPRVRRLDGHAERLEVRLGNRLERPDHWPGVWRWCARISRIDLNGRCPAPGP